MGLSWKIRRPKPELQPARSSQSVSLDSWAGMLTEFGFNGHRYTLPGATQEEPSGLFTSVVQTAYKTNGVVFACMLVRMLLFAEARFKFRRLSSGRPGALWGSKESDLTVLEKPWPGGTTGDMMSRAIQYADLAGNAFIARRGQELVMLRPDWVDIIVGSNTDAEVGAWDVDARAVGYVYHPGGKQSQKPPVMFLADEVAHFAPIPDPTAQFRGMSWLTPLFREVMADKAATDHKLAFFENGATVNLSIKTDAPDAAKYREYQEMFDEKFAGARNAYKTVLLAAGWDMTPVGADFQQMDFKMVQGAGETRIAAAAGVPPIIVGLSEGLQAATYSNYGQARRRFADGTMSPLWRNMCGSLSRIINVPSDSELAVDMRDIPFLKEDQKDASEIQAQEAQTIRTLVDGGYTPQSAVAAVIAGNFNLLVHTGLFSVQLQPPGTQAQEPQKALPANGQKALPAANGTNSSRAMVEELLALVTPEEE